MPNQEGPVRGVVAFVDDYCEKGRGHFHCEGAEMELICLGDKRGGTLLPNAGNRGDETVAGVACYSDSRKPVVIEI
jgi:hypothetical protein